MARKRVLFGFLAAGGLVIAGCASFDGDIPMETVANTAYISPANQDGVQDRLEIDLDVPHIKGVNIKSYRFELLDGLGREVFVRKAELVSDTKVFTIQDPVVIPKKIIWDGREADGSWAADGEYSYQIVVKSMKDQQGKSPIFNVVVDNSAPNLVVSAPYQIFSPNGDGRLDFLPVYQQQSTVEKLWSGSIVDWSAKLVKSLSWEGMAADFNWDGLDNNGKVVSDGVYEYRITSTDPAGNSFEKTLSGLIVDTKPSGISLTQSEVVFSPNGDGVMDSINFIVGAERNDGIKEWRLNVVDSRARIQRTWTGNTLESSIVFDGMNDKGMRVVDGDYYGYITVKYINGDVSETAGEKFVVDTKAPTAVFSTDYLLFSPDGDNRKDSITINQSSSAEIKWTARILNSTGAVIKTAEWSERLVPFVWDGMDSVGKVVPDGVYSYEVKATDWAGNSYTGGVKGISVDTRPTPVTLTSSSTGFSPNGDGNADSIRFVPRPAIREGISSWKLTIAATEVDSLWTREGSSSNKLPESITWDGRNNLGKVVDGIYSAALVIEYEKGNRTETVLDTFVVVDTTPPLVKISFEPLPFSPDGDGFNDVLTIKPEIIDVSPVVSWSLNMRDSHNSEFFSFIRSGKPESFSWDGKGRNGELALSAEDYSVVVEAVDAYGNRGEFNGIIPIDILVIRDGDKLRISISSIYFKPFTADYQDIDPDLARKNVETLNRLAEILKKYGSHAIRLEGHAVRIFWDNPEKWRSEERDVLLPLSKERADVIRGALVARGIPASRITTAGLGGTQPLVPHSDPDNRWKNRRVEFLLVR